MENNLYKIWAAVGPLIGVFIGSWLAARWQQRHWVQDNKKVEYRTVLDAFDKFRWRLTHQIAKYAENPFAADATGEKRAEQELVMEALSSVMGALTNGILIRKAVLDSGVFQRLQNVYHDMESNAAPDIAQVSRAVAEIQLKLLQTAWHDLRLGKPFPWPTSRHPKT
jgi:hypothetical protein